MPTIICSYCEYVGQGKSYEDRLSDVEEHEENCSEKPEEKNETAGDGNT